MLVVVLLSACGGNSTKKAVVIAPAITDFTASSTSITAGDEVTLSWVVTGTAPVKLSITGLGDVTGSSTTATPTETTTYTLTASNSAGNVTKDLTVTVAPKPLELTIRNVDSVVSNFHPNFRPNSARITFYIDFSKAVQASEIESIKIVAEYATNRSWTIDDSDYMTDNLYEFQDGTTGIAVNNLFTEALSDNASAIYLGDYVLTVTLKDSKILSYTHNVPAPSSKGTNGKKYGYTENYSNTANLSAEYVPLLKRAQIQSAVLSGAASKLTVMFAINDSRVYNGSIWMYDKDNNFVGRLKDGLRDPETGMVSSSLNTGTVFKTGGALNTVTVDASQISFQQGKSFNDVAELHVVLYDGRQYKDTSNVFEIDSESISAVKAVAAGPSQ